MNLNSFDYLSHINYYILDLITNTIIPYVSQFERRTEEIYYKRIIQILLQSDYNYQEIYYGLGAYLTTIKENEDDVEEDMIVVRDILHILEVQNQFIINLYLDPLENLEDIKLTISKEELNKIPLSNFSEIKTDEKECSICLDEFESKDPIRMISCHHLFHSKCIDKWLSENNYKCPICRHKIANYNANM